MKTLEIGTVSHGTMRNEDLIPAFLDALYEVSRERCEELRNDANNCISYDGEYDKESIGYVIEELFDALNEYCPPYCYFGAHEGDGSDFGVWVSWEAVEEAFNGGDDECARVNAGDPWPCAPEILEVNDHGNATLWVWDAEEHRHVEAWSVV
jgi:hypothetical protein